jgi:hypothetical protein
MEKKRKEKKRKEKKRKEKKRKEKKRKEKKRKEKKRKEKAALQHFINLTFCEQYFTLPEKTFSFGVFYPGPIVIKPFF